MRKARSTTPKDRPPKPLTRILGAILAGGQSRRFGSDKARALYKGEPLIDHVVRRMGAQTESTIVVGRSDVQYTTIPDQPPGGHGPLAGLNAALISARDDGFDAVLSAGVDVPNLPEDLVTTLAGDGAAIVRSQPVVGLWPVAVADELGVFLKEGGRALYGFAERIGARQIAFDPPLMNVNEPGDLGG